MQRRIWCQPHTRDQRRKRKSQQTVQPDPITTHPCWSKHPFKGQDLHDRKILRFSKITTPSRISTASPRHERVPRAAAICKTNNAIINQKPEDDPLLTKINDNSAWRLSIAQKRLTYQATSMKTPINNLQQAQISQRESHENRKKLIDWFKWANKRTQQPTTQPSS